MEPNVNAKFLVGLIIFSMIVLLIQLSHPVSADAAEYTFYVSTNGNDSWSGTANMPFATLERARNEIRALKQSGSFNRSVNVMIGPGTYYINDTFDLTSEDSGTTQYPITYKAEHGERVVLSGGKRIVGNWTRYNSNIYYIHIVDVEQGRWSFNSLFVSDRRATRARSPNSGYYLIAAVDSSTKYDAFNFSGNDIQANWMNLNDVEVVSYRRFEQSRFRISHVAGNKVYFQGQLPVGYNWDYGGGGRYYLENVFEGLDSPGEWYLDKHTGNLYYWPLSNENISSSYIIAPTLKQLIDIRGASYLTIDGMVLSDTDWELPASGYPGSQAASLLTTPPAINVAGSNHMVFSNDTVSHTGGYGIENNGSEFMSITRSEFFDTGAGGIRVDYDSIGRNIISDNRIHDIGQVYKDSVCIWILTCGSNEIFHNLIYDSGYTGISVGWQWNLGDSAAKNNTIEYNEIHDVMKELNDGAAIYTLGRQPGTILRNNKIHDITATPFHLFNRSLQGIYLDEGSNEITVANNTVYRTQTGGLHLNSNYNNTITNNIFIDGRETALRFNAPNRYFTVPGVFPSENKFTRNIIYSASPIASYVTMVNPVNSSINQSDYNVVFNATVDPAWNFQWWKNTFGFEVHSVVADPLFVDYASNNFRLQENSPALGLGFVQIDMTGVGPRVECFDDSDCSTGKCMQRSCVVMYCGDGACSAGENCTTCPDDCGPCPSCVNGTINNCTTDGCAGRQTCDNETWSPCIKINATCSCANGMIQDCTTDGCAGGQTCYNGIWRVCTKIDAKCNCTNGMVKDCTASGCPGRQTCDNGAWGTCSKVDTCCGVNCNDNDSCTSDKCSNGVCSHTRIPDCGPGLVIDVPESLADGQSFNVTVTTEAGEPVQGVDVSYNGQRAATDSDGKASFTGVTGKIDIVAEKTGYSSAAANIDVSENPVPAQQPLDILADYFGKYAWIIIPVIIGVIVVAFVAVFVLRELTKKSF